MFNPPFDRLARFDNGVVVKQLANKLRLVHIPLQDDPRFLIAATINAGARYEGSLCGVAHFLEHMMFRGSKKFPTFKNLADAFERIGGEWNASTGFEHTDFFFNGNFRYWKEATELFADFFCNPRLNDIEIEREVIKKELQREINEQGISTDLDTHMMALLFPGSDLDRQILGSLQNIRSIRKKHIKAYRQQCYQPQNVVICSVGGSDSPSILDKMEREFSRYSPGSKIKRTRAKKPKPFQGPMITWPQNSDSEYLVQWSYLTSPEWSPDSTIINLICRILSDGYFSKLGSRLRETLGLVYSISADLNQMSNHGTIDISAAVGPQELTKFCRELQKIIQKMTIKKPSLSELKRAKTRALLDLELTLEDPETLYFKYSWYILNKQQPSFQLQAQLIQDVSPEDILRVCQSIFQAKNLGIVFLGPQDDSLQNQIAQTITGFNI